MARDDEIELAVRRACPHLEAKRQAHVAVAGGVRTPSLLRLDRARRRAPDAKMEGWGVESCCGHSVEGSTQGQRSLSAMVCRGWWIYRVGGRTAVSRDAALSRSGRKYVQPSTFRVRLLTNSKHSHSETP